MLFGKAYARRGLFESRLGFFPPHPLTNERDRRAVSGCELCHEETWAEKTACELVFCLYTSNIKNPDLSKYIVNCWFLKKEAFKSVLIAFRVWNTRAWRFIFHKDHFENQRSPFPAAHSPPIETSQYSPTSQKEKKSHVLTILKLTYFFVTSCSKRSSVLQNGSALVLLLSCGLNMISKHLQTDCPCFAKQATPWSVPLWSTT